MLYYYFNILTIHCCVNLPYKFIQDDWLLKVCNNKNINNDVNAVWLTLDSLKIIIK